ncbi:MAG: hypothetical protein SFT68_01335 [Rickettsiaceae bacterium]|nr:hypothetical protein [Rickettsiaceae bacterium]
MTNSYRKLVLTGNIYIKYIDDQELRQGDLRLLMHDDATTAFPGDYENQTMSGYIKAEVFDGKFWQLINLDEFLENREYKYTKKQKPIDTANFCKELLENNSEGVEMFRTYRGHFTKEEYIPQKRTTKANSNRK